MRRAIVLSGGGSKGSYEIGVWKALRKLGIDYDIVTGTSVGALNGALMTQKNYWRAIWLWYNIGFQTLFNETFEGDVNTFSGKKKIYSLYAKNILFDGGMDIKKLEILVEQILNEKKLRESPIDYGLVTVKLPLFQPVLLTKEQIPEGKLKDYLLASATCFPAFKKRKIDEFEFIDGGYHDNMPINLAIDMGAEEIIAVDLNAIGVKRRPKNKNIKITYITPHNDIGSFLIFNKKLARKGMKFGYNDTMKTFHYLEGNRFTFQKGTIKKIRKEYGNRILKRVKRILIAEDGPFYEKILKLSYFKKMMQNPSDTELDHILLETMERIGKIFKLDETEIYSMKKYHLILNYKLRELNDIDSSRIEETASKRGFKALLENKYMIKYLYDKLNQSFYSDHLKKELAWIACVLPKDFLVAIYLKAIQN